MAASLAGGLSVAGGTEAVALRGLMKEKVLGFPLFEKGKGDSICFVQSDPGGHHPNVEQKRSSCKCG